MIELKNISQNNLKNISVELPRNKLIVVTGVSGSGKSSFAFDVINAEGQRQYFVNLSAQARKYLGKLSKPNVEQIKNLTPTISLSQNIANNNPRSTVGTLSDIYDYLRLLFARVGTTKNKKLEINRSLFSFNSASGACYNCNGLGVEDKISVDLLVDDENKTIRNQALKITNPNGYTIYSQVTIDALNKVCNAHNFSVDIAWKDLTQEQKNIILNGSNKITIPYGKHTLESRMKWSGITAKPRPEGIYKGIIPVMEEILIRDRNPNILRFAKTQVCSICNGNRLSKEAESVKINNKTISYFTKLSIDELKKELLRLDNDFVSASIIKEIKKRIIILQDLGLGYLQINRQASELSGGELQRIRLSRQVGSELRNITFVFDEPSIGVHLANNSNIIKILKQLVNNGNTVIVVEHDAQTILSADWIVDIGPKAGVDGGMLLFNGTIKDFFKPNYKSLTKSYLNNEISVLLNFKPVKNVKQFTLTNAEINNLKSINVNFNYNQLNCVTGVSGAGKSSLINQTLIPLLKGSYYKQINAKGKPELTNAIFNKTIFVTQTPIGKTVRSTPATYTKLHDLIRDFYAKLPQARELGFTKSSFSYNVKGGRCEKCQGAGKLEIGMHFLGNVENICDVCNGKRYNIDIQQVKFENKSISDVLNMSVNNAKAFFKLDKKIFKILQLLSDIGLGYLKLGQSSNTLSGGESQRIKLATELAKPTQTNCLYIFEEPTTGLHFYDIQVLMQVFSKILQKGNTIILIEHNEDVIKNSNNIIDIGPNSGQHGGEIIFNGSYNKFLECKNSKTAEFLKKKTEAVSLLNKTDSKTKNITFNSVTTNNLKNIDIEIADNKHTVITGCSGSGKSSLAFDTIFAESQNRFTESFPAYVRQFASHNSKAKFTEAKHLTPVIALKQNNNITDPRSTLGTITEIYDLYRLLFSRFGKSENIINKIDIKKASVYSFNNLEGACEKCSGLGTNITSDINLLVQNFEKSFFSDAFVKHKSLKFYGDVNGQYLSTLKEVGEELNIDFTQSIKKLTNQEIDIALFGSGNKIYNVEWTYKRNNRVGTHNFTGKWLGFVNLLIDEYYRKQANGKGQDMLVLLKKEKCTTCYGTKFKPEILSVKYKNINIVELAEMNIKNSLAFFNKCDDKSQLITNIINKLESLIEFNLGYLSANRQTKTLSNGELQRVLLSSVMQGSLTGITYILDEPTTGLHPRNIEQLIKNINTLVKNGNTVITVEHNISIIKKADRIIEIGPEAGINGGNIISKNNDNILKFEADFLSKNNFKSHFVNQRKSIIIKQAKANNLKNIDIEIPTNIITAITGASGSGKTSLMHSVLYKSYKNKRNINCNEIIFLPQQNIVWIDKTNADKNPLSTVATYIGAFDEIRKLFACTKKAKEHKLKTGDFSFNNKNGQCSECKGIGEIRVSLDFISDVSTVCETCNGKRYKNNILEIEYNNKSLYEVLQMSILESIGFFKDNNKIVSVFNILNRIGLGYLKIGQATSNLSGGEAQRLKLAKDIALQNNKNSTVYIFDEPSKGLQINDLYYLLNTFKLLLSNGNTVVFIEHNPYLIRTANNIIELGGNTGGELIYSGSVKGILNCERSQIREYL